MERVLTNVLDKDYYMMDHLFENLISQNVINYLKLQEILV